MDKDMHEIVFGLLITVGGSLINFISTKVYNFFTGKSKNFLWSDSEVDLKSIKISNDFEELKRRTRVIVIDDEDSFPISLFQNEGYSIDRWKMVTDYNKLENGYFDIIVLDIKGVAQHISLEDGLGVLINLKKKNPAQIIISYSQHSYDLNKVQFFQQADENITKPSDFLKIKNILDNLIISHFKPERYISALNKSLIDNNISQKQIKKLNSDIAKIIKKKEQPNWNIIFDFIEEKSDLRKQLIALSKTIIKFYQ